MADTKISQLPSATTPLSGAELVPLVQSGATVQTPTNEISKLTAATANTFTANQIIEVTDNVNAALRVTQLQKPGGKRLPAREFLAGSPLAAGQRFTLPDVD